MKNKIKLVAVAKDEAAYIPLWVFHHLYFGFDEIEIILNRTNDNSENILKLISNNCPIVKYSKCDWIDLLNSNVSKNLQNIAYAKAYAEAKDSGFSHVFFIDIDEFWVPLDFRKKIQDFVGNFDVAVSVSFQWACELGLDEEFALIQEKGNYVLRPQVKTLISCDANVEQMRIHCPSLVSRSLHILADGNKFTPSNREPQVCHKDSVKLMDAFLIHRIYRSKREYMSTLLRGNPQNQNLEFKKNRDGFHKDHKDKILLSFDSEIFNLYKNLYDNFCESLKINKEIQVAKKYVMDKYVDAVKFVENSIRIDIEGTRKILSGVDIPEVLYFVNKYQYKKNSVDGNVHNIIDISRTNTEDNTKVNEKKSIKLIEVVQTLRATSPELLGQLPDQRLVAIIGAALAQVATAVRDTEEGVVQVPRLGRFAVRQVLREVEGGEAEIVKRVVFHPAPVPAVAPASNTPLA